MAGGDFCSGKPPRVLLSYSGRRAGSRGWSYGSRGAGAFGDEHLNTSWSLCKRPERRLSQGPRAGVGNQNAACVRALCVRCSWPRVYAEEVGSRRSTLQTEMKVNMSTYCRKESEYEHIFRNSELSKVKAW